MAVIAKVLAELGILDSEKPGPGVGIELIDADSVELRTEGLADVEHGVRIGPESNFHVASVAKQFTAFIIATLFARRMAAPDDEIGQFLDWLPDRLARCRIRQLLFHTSGIRDQWALGYFAGLRSGDAIQTDDVRRWLKTDDALNFEPGTRFLYSNSGYTLLALLAERVTGTAFAQLASTLIFQPLSMSGTGFVTDVNAMIPNRVYGYGISAGQLKRNDPPYGVIGSSCLRTSLADMEQWLRQSPSAPFFEAVKSVGYFEPGTLDDGTLLRYGFGQLHTSVAGHPVAMHGGFDYGFNAICARCMDAPIGLFAAGNGSFSTLESAALNLLTEYLGGEQHRPEAAPPASLSEVQLIPQGVFATDDYADVRVIEHLPDGRVWLKWMQGFELKPKAGTDWSVVGTQIVVRSRKRATKVTLEFSNATDTTLLNEVSRVPTEQTALIGRYFSPTLRSILTIERSHAGLSISIGRNTACDLDVVSPALFIWDCYWGTALYDGGSIVELIISHPRCLGVRFARI